MVFLTLLGIAGGLLIGAAVYLLGALEAYPAIAAAGRGLALMAAGGGVATLAGVLAHKRWPMAGPAAFVATVRVGDEQALCGGVKTATRRDIQ